MSEGGSLSETGEQAMKKRSKLRYAFSQQLLEAWRPRPTLKCAIALFSWIGMTFIAFGVAIIVLTNQITALEWRYDNLGAVGATLQFGFTLAQPISAPIYVYYEMRGFYQNHRRYIKSIPSAQLRGEDLSAAALADCSPVIYNADLHPAQRFSAGTGQPLDPAAVAIPCGPAARAFFNDSFELASPSGAVPISATGIARADDVAYKFANIDLSRQWTDVTNERFINWMKTAPFGKFRKTWGVISQNLPAGDYRFTIANNWDSAGFGGEKWIAISQTNALGGRNEFFGYFYIAVGALSLLLAIAAVARKFRRPKGITEHRLARAERDLAADEQQTLRSVR